MASKDGKGKGKLGKLDKYIDYGAAYSMVVSDNMHLLSEAVGAPPGLSLRSVFYERLPKVKQMAEGKGKVVKGKGKFKSKGKSGKVIGKGKGSKGKRKSIDKKGAGKGAFS